MILQSLIIGVVEGITEFLPVSSTAHIILASKVLNTSVSETFTIAIQAGAMAAVLGMYIHDIRRILHELPQYIIALVPTVLVGFLVYPYIAGWHDNIGIIAWALIIGGIIMILIQKQPITREDASDTIPISRKQALYIGLAQACAVIPGVSRSGGIFALGELANIPRVALTRFSFILGAMTIFAATVYSIYKTPQAFVAEVHTIGFWVAFLVAGVSAWFVCKWLLEVMKRVSLSGFGWYRVILGLILIIFLV